MVVSPLEGLAFRSVYIDSLTQLDLPLNHSAVFYFLINWQGEYYYFLLKYVNQFGSYKTHNLFCHFNACILQI